MSRKGIMENYTDEQLKEYIERDYGFKKELIKNPELCGLWHLRFVVNGIKYYGYIAYAGALPQLIIEGYTAEYYDNFDTPVTEDYYNRCLKNCEIVLRRYVGEDDCEDMNISFNSQQEAKDYISKLDNPKEYFYDFV
jgi:hypothetical protein